MSNFMWIHILSALLLTLPTAQLWFLIGAWWEKRKWNKLINNNVIPRPGEVWYSLEDLQFNLELREAEIMNIPAFLRDETVKSREESARAAAEAAATSGQQNNRP